ncbi:protein-export membrane protein SecF [bacterium CG10_46_32]|nr:MAG: protein-export membrane protein SecF [bacterium CG10_46_32]PIR55754.1 MAG: protein translocase subunit SecF [Parcubacteria group bacterium CG10_big_fil_rev_8_21_14_0_10_46_32]
MQIIGHRKIYFAISGAFVAASIAAIALFGLNLGIDFTGGSLLEITMDSRISADTSSITSALITGENPVLTSVQVQPTGEHGFLLRFKDVTEEQHQAIIGRLNAEFVQQLSEDERTASADTEASVHTSGIQATDSNGNPVNIQVEGAPIAESGTTTIGGISVVIEDRFESIGPVIGEELKQKSLYAMVAVIVAIVLYIAWAFRKVSDPVSSWKYGVSAVVALGHDVIIPTGVFVILGKVAGIEIDILFVTALLTILGFSVNDTIIVFDRTRENLSRDHHRHEFDWIVNRSVNETMRRSVYTSLTVFLVLGAIYFYGGDSIKNFALALIIGVVVGTYSSIFLASPLLVEWEKRSRR